MFRRVGSNPSDDKISPAMRIIIVILYIGQLKRLNCDCELVYIKVKCVWKGIIYIIRNDDQNCSFGRFLCDFPERENWSVFVSFFTIFPNGKTDENYSVLTGFSFSGKLVSFGQFWYDFPYRENWSVLYHRTALHLHYGLVRFSL